MINSVEEAIEFKNKIHKHMDECATLCIEAGLPRFGAIFMFISGFFGESIHAVEAAAMALRKVSEHFHPELKDDNLTMQ